MKNQESILGILEDISARESEGLNPSDLYQFMAALHALTESNSDQIVTARLKGVVREGVVQWGGVEQMNEWLQSHMPGHVLFDESFAQVLDFLFPGEYAQVDDPLVLRPY